MLLFSMQQTIFTSILSSLITPIILLILTLNALCWSGAVAATCASQKPCLDGSCCSQYGFCGNTSGFCGNGCISLCKHSNSSTLVNETEAVVSGAISDEIFDQFFYAYDDVQCPAHGFYNRSSFLAAAATFPTFGTSGGFNASRRELAAFFAYASQVTGGGCYVEAIDKSLVGCIQTSEWNCTPGKKYYGRSPLQIAWNTNYGPMGVALGFDGITDPDLIAQNPILSFRASLWYWMTPQPSHTYSCHEAILTPGQGFNAVILIINGGPLDPNSLQQRTQAYDSFYSLLVITSNGSNTSPSPTSRRCIGSLCSTRSKVVGLVVPLALGGVMFLVLAFWALNSLWKHRCGGRHEGFDSVNLESIQDLAGTPINFPYAVLASATNSFTAVLGEGGFGIVYKGVLPSGESIAVKVLNESSHTERQFLREIETLGKLHHVNVVRLVGFCIEKMKKILVYEFISNCSLEKHLFEKSMPGKEIESMLSWERRYEIALGIARGLSYIHEECLHRIIHRDLKPQNVLLDETFCPKISDFGLAKIIKRQESKIVSSLKGTPGYMAPEFWAERKGQLSTKFDVYGFGMVAFELVSGRPNFKEGIPSEQAYFPEWAFTHLSAPSSIVDHRIADQANLSQVQVLLHVALWCIQEDPSLRPSMSRVVQYLEGNVDVPVCPPKPFKDVTMDSSIDGSTTF